MPMAYDPGALEAALAAAVGDEPGLIAELRDAFFERARVHVTALRHAATLDDWHAAAARLHSLAASFGALRLMDVATDAAQASKIESLQLRKIERAIAALDL
jgi:HPt (histidine-containing phosphotransfer) domain-containing protein